MTRRRSDELQQRLADAEAEIEALRSGQVDAIVGVRGVSLLREREYEAKYHRSVKELAAANAELDAARRAALNLMNDAIAAREAAEQAERAVRQSEERLRELNRTLEARVAKRTVELRILASRVAFVQETERHRIATGLHDSVCQLLAACQLKLAEAEACGGESERQDLLQAADGILRDANNEVRGLTFELSSSALFDGELPDSARDLCAYMSRRYGVAFELTSTDREIRVPRQPCAALYHCLRELMHNVVKHAGVDHATVRVETLPPPVAAVRISVRDHGNGFDPESLKRPLTWQGGLGLRQVRERMRDIGGTLSIESVPGDGTKAVLKVHTGRSWPAGGDP